MFKIPFFANRARDTDRIGVTTSNVRGVTGLSRRALTAMLTRDGLFGRDSTFAIPDQRAILRQLGVSFLWRHDRASRHAIPLALAHLPALKAFVEIAACGEGTVSRGEWRQAGDAGLTLAQRGEVLAVVGLLHATLGLMRPPIAGDARVVSVPVSDGANVSRAA